MVEQEWHAFFVVFLHSPFPFPLLFGVYTFTRMWEYQIGCRWNISFYRRHRPIIMYNNYFSRYLNECEKIYLIFFHQTILYHFAFFLLSVNSVLMKRKWTENMMKNRHARILSKLSTLRIQCPFTCVMEMIHVMISIVIDDDCSTAPFNGFWFWIMIVYRQNAKYTRNIN